jgi:hypothetical protein
MTKQSLNGADIVIGLKKMRGEGVAESVRSDTLGELGPADRLIKRQLDVCFMKMIPPQLLRYRAAFLLPQVEPSAPVRSSAE